MVLDPTELGHGKSLVFTTKECTYLCNLFLVSVLSMNRFLLQTLHLPCSVVSENIASADEAAPSELERSSGAKMKGKEKVSFFYMKQGSYTSGSPFTIIHIFAYHAMLWLHRKGMFESFSMC